MQNVGSFISRAAAAASRASASLVPALALWVMAGRVRGGPLVRACAEPKRSEGNTAFSSLREARKSHSGVTNVPTGTTRQRGEVILLANYAKELASTRKVPGNNSEIYRNSLQIGGILHEKKKMRKKHVKAADS